jgi:hypothetical protein
LEKKRGKCLKKGGNVKVGAGEIGRAVLLFGEKILEMPGEWAQLCGVNGETDYGENERPARSWKLRSPTKSGILPRKQA